MDALHFILENPHPNASDNKQPEKKRARLVTACDSWYVLSTRIWCLEGNRPTAASRDESASNHLLMPTVKPARRQRSHVSSAIVTATRQSAASRALGTQPLQRKPLLHSRAHQESANYIRPPIPPAPPSLSCGDPRLALVQHVRRDPRHPQAGLYLIIGK